MAVLVTGGTGFIGAEVVRILLAQGEDEVVTFDIDPASRRLGDAADSVESIQGDLGNFSHVLSAVERTRPTRIFHLGAMLSVPSDADPAASLHANVLGTYHVLEAARLFEVPQVLFSSTLGTYGLDIREPIIGDYTLQRPTLFYGMTKVFGEHLGLFYRRKHDLDFRAIRYPSVVGPGVRTPGIAQYTSWMIERCANGESFTVWVNPDTSIPIIYFKDAALALVRLAAAPREGIEMVNYLVDGVTPTPTAAALATAVRARMPDADIRFEPDPDLLEIVDRIVLPLDDSLARAEWGWEPSYQLEAMVDDFLSELESNPKRYR